jgi:hypothetical protein
MRNVQLTPTKLACWLLSVPNFPRAHFCFIKSISILKLGAAAGSLAGARRSEVPGARGARRQRSEAQAEAGGVVWAEAGDEGWPSLPPLPGRSPVENDRRRSLTSNKGVLLVIDFVYCVMDFKTSDELCDELCVMCLTCDEWFGTRWHNVGYYVINLKQVGICNLDYYVMNEFETKLIFKLMDVN